MSGFSLRGGWHPKDSSKSGKSTSLRNDFKGVNQVAGLVGKGKSNSSAYKSGYDPAQHHAAPLSTLKDPASFGPPPKHIGARDVGTSSSTSSPSEPSISRPQQPPRKQPGGLGSTKYGEAAQPAAAQEQEEEEKPKGPPVPFRADRTGINTSALPRPPGRHASPALTEDDDATPAPSKPQPPPRLPPRQNSHPDENSPAPPPPYTENPTSADLRKSPQSGLISQGAASRLGKAGVSVPGFNIGKSNTSDSPESNNAAAGGSDLATRFGRLTTSNGSTSSASFPSKGTTWAQKQSALSTAQKFQKDPSSINFSDARDAASTANNFRQRHGDQVAAGWKAANGASERLGGIGIANGQVPAGQDTGKVQSDVADDATRTAAAAKPKPPPPPKKKLGLTAAAAAAGTQAASEGSTPPPIPSASKPR